MIILLQKTLTMKLILQNCKIKGNSHI